MTPCSSNQPLSCPLCAYIAIFFFTDTKNYKHTYYHCKQCDLVFVAPRCRLDYQEERARYDMHRNDYSTHYINFLSRLYIPLISRLHEHVNGLDFGSGESQAMAEQFRQVGHGCVCYDVFYFRDDGLLTKRYDFIVASEVIEHLYTPKSVFEDWLKMLKPNGILGIMTGLRPQDDFANWWYKNDPTHVSLFSRQTFTYLRTHYNLRCVYQLGNVMLFVKIVPTAN